MVSFNTKCTDSITNSKLLFLLLFVILSQLPREVVLILWIFFRIVPGSQENYHNFVHSIKGTQAWDNFDFFVSIKSLYALWKCLKKISLLFLQFSPEFLCSNISAVTEHTRNQIFFERYPKYVFLNLHFGPIMGS